MLILLEKSYIQRKSIYNSIIRSRRVKISMMPVKKRLNAREILSYNVSLVDGIRDKAQEIHEKKRQQIQDTLSDWNGEANDFWIARTRSKNQLFSK